MENLPSIKGLIASIGDFALEDFCRRGQLDIKFIDSIRAARGPEMPFSDEDVSEEAEDSAESEAGYEVRQGRHMLVHRNYPDPRQIEVGEEEDV